MEKREKNYATKIQFFLTRQLRERIQTFAIPPQCRFTVNFIISLITDGFFTPQLAYILWMESIKGKASAIYTKNISHIIHDFPKLERGP